MGDRLATIDEGQKEGSCMLCSFPGEGELGPHLIHCGLGRVLLPYQVTS